MRRSRLTLALSVLLSGAAEQAAATKPAPTQDAAWLARAQQGLAEREYRASENGAGLQAPNRAHNLRTWFDKTGIRVHDRTAGGSPELLRLSLAGVGRGAAPAAVPAGEAAVVAEGRVEIRRPGILEWYVNSPAGLEQGFTLAERPVGDGPLVIELAVAGAEARLSGEAIAFATGARRVLRYGELVAADAAGRRLPARFELPGGDRLRIVVEDAGASYPLVIDPLLTETADTQLESDQASAGFGWSVAGAGDVNGDGYADVIVGATAYDAGQEKEGAAFVFLGSAAGIADATAATAAAQLESDQAFSEFGRHVAGAGDVNGDGYADVIVGAPIYDAGEADEGAAFVFLGSASGIADGNPGTATTKLESNQAAAELGSSVAGAGDVNGDGYADVIVGASEYDSGHTNEGAAFVFLGSASGVADGNPAMAAAQLEADQGIAALGVSVAGAGDVNGDGYADVIVGADRYANGQVDEGAAFVFVGGAAGIADGTPATAAAQLESNQASAQLGYSVAGAGDVNGDGYADVIVGAFGYFAGETAEGAAFVFLGGAAGVADGTPATAAAQLESNQAFAGLGHSVAGAGDVNGDGYSDVIVGASLYDNGQTDEGAAFVFLGSATGIPDGNSGTAYAQLESDQLNGQLDDVAGAGDVNGDGYADVIVGAFNYDSGQSDEGAAFVYLGGAVIADSSPQFAATGISSDQAGGHLGYSVASAGDVNGDGYGDVIVGAYQYDSGQTDEGAAFVFHGSASGIASGVPSSAAAQLESDQAFGYLGWSVAGAGDVNADGYADVIVGAFAFDNGQSNEGAAFLFYGSATGVADGNPLSAPARLESNQVSAQLGGRVASAGDVNGDGYADVIVGASLYDNGQTDEGAAFVFHGSATGLANGDPSTAVAQLESNQVAAELGYSVAGAGDVNGDGYADVIVGARRYDAGQTDEGAAFVFPGSATGVADGNPLTAAAQLESNQVAAQLGYSVAGAGDVNGDGYADVIVGARDYVAGEAGEGAAFVFHGSATGISDGHPGTAAAQLESDQAGAGMGSSVAGAGDVNGDGYADVIVGAYSYENPPDVDEGAAFGFLGSAAGITGGDPGTAAWELQSDQDSARLESAAGAGDVNGDGYADVIIGSRYLNEGLGVGQGAAFVFLGNGGGDGRPVHAQQLRPASNTPIEPWGRTHSMSVFRARLQATHPEGRGRVKLRVEYCPPGVAFGHASCGSRTSTSWTDVTATSGGVTLTETVNGLVNNQNYRWRARVLYAPFSVTQAGITAPPNPARGPWRRVGAQAVEADLRTKRNSGCGLGFELAPLLPALAWRKRGRRCSPAHRLRR